MKKNQRVISKIYKIKRKFSYNKELAAFIFKLYPLLVSYFEDEDIVFNALKSVKIVIHPNLAEYVENNRELLKAMTPDEADGIAGLYISVPNVIYDRVKCKYEIESVERYILIRGEDLSSEIAKSSLIHEICHLIKSYYGEYEIREDTFVQRSGFVRAVRQIYMDENTKCAEIVFEDGLGLEEGFNEQAENEIAELLDIHAEPDTAYMIPNQIASVLMNLNIPDFKRRLIKAQLYHDNRDIEKELGIGFHEFLDLADICYFKTAMLICEDIDKETREERYNELYSYVEKTNKEIFQHIRTHRKAKEK